MPGTDFMVVDFTTGEPQRLGEAGEIVVRGPSVLTRYRKSPAANAAGLRDGRLHTGDIGSLDEKVPGIELLDSFPMTATGKIKKAELRPAGGMRGAVNSVCPPRRTRSALAEKQLPSR
ncbi:hypothetical protein [Streptomyces sp900116325]|uniref:hypothetical protein n=1 Tax=Streptomyces sp. 900116325 TaxID=3154295 RepID=UPI00331673B3